MALACCISLCCPSAPTRRRSCGDSLRSTKAWRSRANSCALAKPAASLPRFCGLPLRCVASCVACRGVLVVSTRRRRLPAAATFAAHLHSLLQPLAAVRAALMLVYLLHDHVAYLESVGVLGNGVNKLAHQRGLRCWAVATGQFSLVYFLCFNRRLVRFVSEARRIVSHLRAQAHKNNTFSKKKPPHGTLLTPTW